MAKTWQVVLATIAIFAAGLIAGGATAFGMVRWSHNHSRASAAPFAAHFGPPQQFGPQLMRNFAQQLDLTDEQRGQIEPIVRTTANQLGRDRREVQLATALSIEKMQDDIAAVLHPEQRVRFDALIAQQRLRLKELRRENEAQMRQGQPGVPK